MGTNVCSSNEAVARNPHMVITVKIIDEVVAGQQDPNFDAWLEWLRSAPPDADRIGINVAENAHQCLKDGGGESLPCSGQGEELQSEISGRRTSSLNEEQAGKKKALSVGRGGYAFNPIRTGLINFIDLDQSSLNLINDVRRIISDKGRYS